MTEQERAAALADEIDNDLWVITNNGPVEDGRESGEDDKIGGDELPVDDLGLIVSALRAYARPAQADLREAICDVLFHSGTPPLDCSDDEREAWGDRTADAVLSLLPQTQESDALTDMRDTLQRLVDLTPQRANTKSAADLHLSVKAIAASAIERLDRAKEG